MSEEQKIGLSRVISDYEREARNPQAFSYFKNRVNETQDISEETVSSLGAETRAHAAILGLAHHRAQRLTDGEIEAIFLANKQSDDSRWTVQLRNAYAKLGVSRPDQAIKFLGVPGNRHDASNRPTSRVQENRKQLGNDWRLNLLSPKEREVIEFMVANPLMTQKEIAREFGVSVNTIHTQVRKIREKLGVKKIREVRRMLSQY